eukprot:gene382-449_t
MPATVVASARMMFTFKRKRSKNALLEKPAADEYTPATIEDLFGEISEKIIGSAIDILFGPYERLFSRNRAVFNLALVSKRWFAMVVRVISPMLYYEPKSLCVRPMTKFTFFPSSVRRFYLTDCLKVSILEPKFISIIEEVFFNLQVIDINIHAHQLTSHAWQSTVMAMIPSTLSNFRIRVHSATNLWRNGKQRLYLNMLIRRVTKRCGHSLRSLDISASFPFQEEHLGFLTESIEMCPNLQALRLDFPPSQSCPLESMPEYMWRAFERISSLKSLHVKVTNYASTQHDKNLFLFLLCPPENIQDFVLPKIVLSKPILEHLEILKWTKLDVIVRDLPTKAIIPSKLFSDTLTQLTITLEDYNTIDTMTEVLDTLIGHQSLTHLTITAPPFPKSNPDIDATNSFFHSIYKLLDNKTLQTIRYEQEFEQHVLSNAQSILTIDRFLDKLQSNRTLKSFRFPFRVSFRRSNIESYWEGTPSASGKVVQAALKNSKKDLEKLTVGEVNKCIEITNADQVVTCFKKK